MMEAAQANSPTTLQITRMLDAPRERVFEAWTQPAFLKEWWGVAEDYQTTVVEVDLRAGGRYRLGMKAPSGTEHVVGGTFREVCAPERLVYTWGWEGSTDFPDTVVRVEFRACGPKTEIVLTHELLPSANSCEEHGKGWNGCLDQLVKRLA
jgi:uncharacterized protein YndB with AHSA1/START domain